MSSTNLAHLVFAKCNQHLWPELPAGVLPWQIQGDDNSVQLALKAATSVDGDCEQGSWDDEFESLLN